MEILYKDNFTKIIKEDEDTFTLTFVARTKSYTQTAARNNDYFSIIESHSDFNEARARIAEDAWLIADNTASIEHSEEYFHNHSDEEIIDGFDCMTFNFVDYVESVRVHKIDISDSEFIRNLTPVKVEINRLLKSSLVSSRITYATITYCNDDVEEIECRCHSRRNK